MRQFACLFAYTIRRIGNITARAFLKRREISKNTAKKPIPKDQPITQNVTQNGSKSIDELMKEFKTISVNSKKLRKKVKKSKNEPIGSSVPRIVKSKSNRAGTAKKSEDETSVKCNKYHKRFVKTKKPTKL